MHKDAATAPPPDNAAEWLAHLADMVGAEAGAMLTVSPGGGHELVTQGHSERAIAEYRDHFSRLDPLPTLLAERPDGRALVFDTTTHPAYVAQRELSDAYLQPHGIYHIIATSWRQPNGIQRYVSVQRFRGAAPFHPRQGAEFDALIQHWRVGEALPPPPGFNLRENPNRRICDIAAQLTLPLAVVDGHLRVVWANPAAHHASGAAWAALLDSPTDCRRELDLQRRLLELIHTCLRQGAEAEAILLANDGRWFAVAAPLHGKPGLILLRMAAHQHFASGLHCRLERLFGLTRTEAEIAVLIAQGQSPEAIATARGVRFETVRTQLRGVFKKTETHRQAELVYLVGWVAG